MNSDLNFFRVADPEEPGTPEEFDDSGCTCENPSDQFLVSIEEGSIYLRHKDCGKPPPASWGDWNCLVEMPEFQARVAWTSHPCTCNFMVQLSCDCDSWLNVEYTGKV